ncbi:hypothetical protein [Nostoc sp.]|uniref:hypothetical protein n=1 Tax=Nostoc sp. TaxID=1180 RepID=UPI002FFB0E9A
MEALGNVAADPVKGVWNWISESANQIATESSILAKGWHLFVILFLLCVLVLASTWFIIVKATQVTLIIAVGVFSITLMFNSDG